MKMKKTNLTKIVLASALGLAASACSTFKYTQSGLSHINKEARVEVTVTKWYFPNKATTVEINSPYEGTKILYSDMEGNDLQIETIDVTREGKTTTYYKNGFLPKVMERGQRQFENYLQNAIMLEMLDGIDPIEMMLHMGPSSTKDDTIDK